MNRFHFPANFDQAAYYFWCGVSGDVSRRDYPTCLSRESQQTQMWLTYFLLVVCVCAYVCMCTCGCAVCMFMLICYRSYPPLRCSNHQRAYLESCFGSCASLHFTSSHTAVEIHEFDCISSWFFHSSHSFHPATDTKTWVKHVAFENKSQIIGSLYSCIIVQPLNSPLLPSMHLDCWCHAMLVYLSVQTCWV